MRLSLLCVLALSMVAGAPVLAQSPAPAPTPNETHTMSWPNGDTFTGVFKDGLPNGPGSYTTGGRTYTGEWKDGCLSTRDGHRFAVNTTLDRCPTWRKPGFSRPDIR